MKVALLLFGQPRNVDNPNSFNSHQKWIFDEYDVDTFCMYGGIKMYQSMMYLIG